MRIKKVKRFSQLNPQSCSLYCNHMQTAPSTYFGKIPAAAMWTFGRKTAKLLTGPVLLIPPNAESTLMEEEDNLCVPVLSSSFNLRLKSPDVSIRKKPCSNHFSSCPKQVKDQKNNKKPFSTTVVLPIATVFLK